jgi:hypothetical protein
VSPRSAMIAVVGGQRASVVGTSIRRRRSFSQSVAREMPTRP